MSKLYAIVAAFIAMFTAFALHCTNPFIAVAANIRVRTHGVLITIFHRPDTVPKAFAVGPVGQTQLHTTVGHIEQRRHWMKSTLVATFACIAILVTSVFLIAGMIAAPVALGIAIVVSASSLAYMKIGMINVSDVVSKTHAMRVASTRVARVLATNIISTSAAYRLLAVKSYHSLVLRPNDDASTAHSPTVHRHPQGSSLVSRTLANINVSTDSLVHRRQIRGHSMGSA